MATSKPRFTATLDTYLSVLAVVSSFCAIGITFYQAYLQRTQQYASVIPIVDSYHTARMDDNTRVSATIVTNSGLGPALIDSVQYYYLNKRFNNIHSLMEAVKNKAHISDSTLLTSDLQEEKVITPGEKIVLYQTSNQAVRSKLQQQAPLINCVIYYRSIYGEHWVLDPRRTSRNRNRKLR